MCMYEYTYVRWEYSDNSIYNECEERVSNDLYSFLFYRNVF